MASHENIRKRNRTLTWAAGLAFGAASSPILSAGQRFAKWPPDWPLQQTDLVLFGMACIVSLGLLGLGLLFRRMVHQPQVPPHEWRLQPDPQNIVQRTGDDVRLVLQLQPRLQNIITGSSGAGKSTIVQTNVIDHLNSAGHTTCYIRDYGDFLADLVSRLRSVRTLSTSYTAAPQDTKSKVEAITDAISNHQGKIYVFLDQFETEISKSAATPSVAAVYTSILPALCDLDNVFVSILVRKEWLFDASQFLASCGVNWNMVPFSPDPGDSIKWLDRFERKIGRDLAKRLYDQLQARQGGFLAIEARMIEVVLSLTDDDIKRQALAQQGVDALIAEFFSRILKGSPETSTDSLAAAKILTALVAERPGLREPKSIDEISRLVHEDFDTVSDVCTYLAGREILAQPRAGYFVVTHDYVSDYMASAPDVQIDPADRDNVRTFKFRAAQDRMLSQFIRFVPPPRITVARILMALYVILAVTAIVLGFVYRDALMTSSKAAFDAISQQTALGARWQTFLYLTSIGQDPIWYALGPAGANYRAVMVLAIAAVQIMFMLYLGKRLARAAALAA